MLLLRQEPDRARISGPTDGDTRTVDPPPILQFNPKCEFKASYVVKAELWTSDKTTKILKPYLAGSLVESSQSLIDDYNVRGHFFCFTNLSVKTVGNFSIKFILYDLDAVDDVFDTTVEPCHEIFSSPFPGMSTD